MDSKLKNLVKLLADDKTDLQVLTRELAAFQPTMEKNEFDRHFNANTIQRLHRERLNLLPRCN